jgi:hypothetical protein
MLSKVVRGAHGVTFGMRELAFNNLMVPALFMQQGLSHAAKPVTGHLFFRVPHAAQRCQYGVFAHRPPS